MSFSAIASGFAFGFGLIFSIGPQNLMLIRAGIARSHTLLVASTGYASEVVLVALGIGGLGTVLTYHPGISTIMQIACAAYLTWWGASILGKLSRAADVQVMAGVEESFYQAMGSMLVVTWLNPLAWLEAMFLVGVLSSGHDAVGFAAGFLAASAIKFYGWSFAGMTLSSYFGGGIARRRLDAIAGFVLLIAAVLLGTSAFR